jgi:hypothetical protein
MKDACELLREKEAGVVRLQQEIEALRLCHSAAPR